MRISPTTISALLKGLERKKILKKLARKPNFSDEPPIFMYSANLNNTKKFSDGYNSTLTSTGISFSSAETALLKCLGEAIERFSILCYQEKDLLYSSFSQLKQDALDPKLYKDNQAIEERPLGWAKGVRLNTSSECLIPAQAIYLNYKISPPEVYLTDQVFSGSAGGFDLESALLRGLYEVVERDAFMTMYLAKISPPKIALSSFKNKQILRILESCKRYNLSVELFDITNDTEIPCFLTAVLDKTGFGPPITFGLKSSLNEELAIIGSLEEAFTTRHWIRIEFLRRKPSEFKINPKRVVTIMDRALFWLYPGMINNLQFLLDQPPKKSAPKASFSLNINEELDVAKDLLTKKGFDIFYADVNIRDFRKLGYFVYKVVIPKLQPLFLDESKRELRMDRLNEVSKYFGQKKLTINPIPHPFL